MNMLRDAYQMRPNTAMMETYTYKLLGFSTLADAFEKVLNKLAAPKMACWIFCFLASAITIKMSPTTFIQEWIWQYPLHVLVVVIFAIADWVLSMMVHAKEGTFSSRRAKMVIVTVLFYIFLLSALHLIGKMVLDLQPTDGLYDIYTIACNAVVLVLAVSDFASIIRHAAKLRIIKGAVADYILKTIDTFKDKAKKAKK